MRADDGGWETPGPDGIVRREWRVEDVGPASVEVDAARGARIRRLRLGGHDLLVDHAADVASAFRDGMFLMAPYAGRVARAQFAWEGASVQLPMNAPPHSAHGVVADVTWRSTTPGAFTTLLDGRWPFGGWASIDIEIRATGLRLEARVGGAWHRMPTNIGWHPWFRRRIDGVDGSLVWDVPMVYREDDGITSRSLTPRDPTSRTWTAPPGDADPVVRWPGMFDLRLTSAEARCWVVHETPDAICVEPQTAPGDALNAGDAVSIDAEDTTLIDLELAFTARGGSGTDAAPARERPVARDTPRPPSRRDRTGRS